MVCQPRVIERLNVISYYSWQQSAIRFDEGFKKARQLSSSENSCCCRAATGFFSSELWYFEKKNRWILVWKDETNVLSPKMAKNNNLKFGQDTFFQKPHFSKFAVTSKSSHLESLSKRSANKSEISKLKFWTFFRAWLRPETTTMTTLTTMAQVSNEENRRVLESNTTSEMYS